MPPWDLIVYFLLESLLSIHPTNTRERSIKTRGNSKNNKVINYNKIYLFFFDLRVGEGIILLLGIGGILL
jgi:hypothetical protein